MCIIFIAPNLSFAKNSNVRSIQEWTKCNGTADDLIGLTKAINAAKNGEFVLNIDCPIYAKIGMDIAKPIFINSNTTIKFSGNGVIIVDNVLVPAFVIADSSNINLINWNVKYRGGLPISDITGGYYKNNVFVSASGKTPSAHAFTNVTLKNWLIANKHIRYENKTSSFWTGPLDPAAIFYIKGSSSNINITNMSLSASDVKLASNFIPIAFSLNPGEVENCTISSNKTISKPCFDVPHNIIFENIKLDGYYFGWHGSGQNITIKNVKASHYGDLQDQEGGNVGGANFWFPPPHLFYFNTQENFDSTLLNNKFLISDVMDYGLRLGVARDKGGDIPLSGSASSLKIQANNSVVDKYTSFRPDGLMDILTSRNLTIKNVVARYNSAFLNYTLPMIRFTQKNNHNVKLENLSLRDDAPFTYIEPIIGYDNNTNTGIQFINVKMKLNHWGEPSPPLIRLTTKSTTLISKANGNKFDVKVSYLGIQQNNNVKDKKQPQTTYLIGVSDPTTQLVTNNTLRNIPVGSFGLRAYIISNNSTSDMIAVNFPSDLPNNMSYDTVRSSCTVDNKMNLAKGESCVVVFKYQPSVKGVNDVFIVKISAKNKLGKTLKSEAIYVPYSSRF